MKYLNYIFVLAILVIAGCVEKDVIPPALNNSSVDSANLSSNLSVNLSKVYTTSELKESSADLINQTVKVTGEITFVYYCPPCPAGAMCKPCMNRHLLISDGKNIIYINFFEGIDYYNSLSEGDVITVEVEVKDSYLKDDKVSVAYDFKKEIETKYKKRQINGLKVYTPTEILENPNITDTNILVSGSVTFVSYCPPCPEGAMCEPCQTEQIRLTDGKNELSILFYDSNGRDYHSTITEGDEITIEIVIEKYGEPENEITQYVFVKSIEQGIQLQKFFDAGCFTDSQGDLDCQSASFVSEFKCESYILLTEQGENLNPKLVLLECPVVMQNYNVGDYFNCDGGFIYTCLSYVTFHDNQFVNIKNPEEFAAVFAPIESEEEALDFALLSYDGLDKVQNKSGVLFEARSEKSGENFAVTIYERSSQFGCYSEVHYYEVTYEVTKNGSITQKNRETVYTEDLGYLICVD